MRSSFFKDPVILTAEEIADTVAAGTSSPELVKSAVLDALENGGYLSTGINLSQSSMSLDSKGDGKLSINYATSEIIAPGLPAEYWWEHDESGKLVPAAIAREAIAPKTASAMHNMAFERTDGGYKLTAIDRQEGWDRDLDPRDGYVHFKSMVVHTDIKPDSYEYAVNLKHVMQTRDRQLRDFTHDVKTRRYATQAAIADRIEAATCPEDIEDIRAKHKRTEMTDDMRAVIETDPTLKAAFKETEKFEAEYGYSAVSNIICNARTAEEFQMAAAIYRRHFVHEHDRLGAPEEPFVSSDEGLSEEQKRRAHLFGIHYQQDSKGLVKEILKLCGEQMENAAQLACAGVNQQICRQAELMSRDEQGKFKRARSDNGRKAAVEMSATALSLAKDVLGGFNRFAKSEGPISIMTMLGDGERGTAKALQAVLSKSNALGGNYCGPVSKAVLDTVFGKLES